MGPSSTTKVPGGPSSFMTSKKLLPKKLLPKKLLPKMLLHSWNVGVAIKN
jgi:hypothetical protein